MEDLEDLEDLEDSRFVIILDGVQHEVKDRTYHCLGGILTEWAVNKLPQYARDDVYLKIYVDDSISHYQCEVTAYNLIQEMGLCPKMIDHGVLGVKEYKQISTLDDEVYEDEDILYVAFIAIQQIGDSVLDRFFSHQDNLSYRGPGISASNQSFRSEFDKLFPADIIPKDIRTKILNIIDCLVANGVRPNLEVDHLMAKTIIDSVLAKYGSLDQCPSRIIEKVEALVRIRVSVMEYSRPLIEYMASKDLAIVTDSPMMPILFPNIPFRLPPQKEKPDLTSYSPSTMNYKKKELLNLLIKNYNDVYMSKLYELNKMGFISNQDIINSGLHHMYSICWWMANKINRVKGCKALNT